MTKKILWQLIHLFFRNLSQICNIVYEWVIFLNINNYLSLGLLIATSILIYIGCLSWKRNMRYVSMTLIPLVIYAFGYAFEILCTTVEGVKLWIKVEYLGISFISVVSIIGKTLILNDVTEI